MVCRCAVAGRQDAFFRGGIATSPSSSIAAAFVARA